MSAAAVVAAAQALLGVPFRHQGRTQHGLDCIGLVILARHRASPAPHLLKTERTYPRNPTGRLTLQIPSYATQIEEPEPGAIALIAWPGQAEPCHVGIVTPDLIVHAYAAAERVVQTGYRGFWLRMTRSLWRMNGVVQP